MQLTEQASSHGTRATGVFTALAAAMGDAEPVAAIFLLAVAHLAFADATVHVATSLALLSACTSRVLAALAAAVGTAETATLGAARASAGTSVLTPGATAMGFAAAIGLSTTHTPGFHAFLTLCILVASALWRRRLVSITLHGRDG